MEGESRRSSSAEGSVLRSKMLALSNHTEVEMMVEDSLFDDGKFS